jgi:hypothetical protein
VVALVLAAIVFAFVGYVGLQLVRFTQNPEISLNGPVIRQMQPGSTFVQLSGGGTPMAAITATGADTGAAEPVVRTVTAGEDGDWSINLELAKGENHFTLVGTDPETARDSEPLRVIVTVPIDDGTVPKGDLQPALPEGAADTNITGIPSAEVTLTEPVKGFRTKNGQVQVAGVSEAETVTVSFAWRGNKNAEKSGPPERTVPVKDGVFKDTFQLPKGRWILYASASIDGGVPAVANVPIRSLNDKMAVRVEAVNGKTRVRLMQPDGDIIDEKVLLQRGQSRTWRVDPDVILRVGNAKAANVTVDGISHGVMGKQAVPAEWRIIQGQKPKKLG